MKNIVSTLIMKTSKFLAFFAVVALAFVTSCVQDDDYSIPESVGDEENVRLEDLLNDIDAGTVQLVTLQEVKDLYVAYVSAQSGFDYDRFLQITSDLAIKGYVSSSDQSGNLYKEFYLQDLPQNPTTAVAVILNQVDSYNQFNQGREVYIKLKDMYIGETPLEVITIGGKTDEDEVGQFTAAQIPTQIFRSSVTEAIVPLELSFSEINENNVGMLVKVNDAQFPESLEGMPYFDPSEDFDTQRTIQACDGFGYSNFILETSSFANFANMIMPTETGGSITGIITKSYGGDSLIMTLNKVEDVEFTNSRCEPLDINDFTVVFEDDFSAGIAAWNTYNVDGNQVWGQTSFGNPGPSAYMNGYSGGPQDNEDWLITPAIDLSSVTNTVFFFETDKRYDGNDLEVFISTDYSGGDPNTDGTWTQVDAVMDPNSGAWSTWTNSGTVDASSADGQMLYIAFKYTSTTSAAATFELDNFTVLGL